MNKYKFMVKKDKEEKESASDFTSAFASVKTTADKKAPTSTKVSAGKLADKKEKRLEEKKKPISEEEHQKRLKILKNIGLIK